VSHISISIDYATLKKNNITPTQALLDALADITRQVRSDADTAYDDARALQWDHDQERLYGWSVK
jgi:hypothetical protein